jgi:hypothetical protein
MATAQNLIVSAAQYKSVLTLNNKLPFLLLSLEEISFDATREHEYFYAIGQQEPFGQNRNAATFAGSMTLQAGEFATILKAAGLVEGTQIEGATLAITSLNVAGIQYVFNELCINSQGLSVKAKEKDSKISLKWNALSVSGITA